MGLFSKKSGGSMFGNILRGGVSAASSFVPGGDIADGMMNQLNPTPKSGGGSMGAMKGKMNGRVEQWRQKMREERGNFSGVNVADMAPAEASRFQPRVGGSDGIVAAPSSLPTIAEITSDPVQAVKKATSNPLILLAIVGGGIYWLMNKGKKKRN